MFSGVPRPRRCCAGWGGMSAILLHSTSDGLGDRRLMLTRFFQRIIDAEAGWLLAWRELLKRLEVLGNDGLCRHQQKRAIDHPLVIEKSCVEVRALEWIAPHVEDFRYSEPYKRFLPDTETLRTLLQKNRLPLRDADSHQVAIVTPVHESLAWILFDLALEE